jgi:hypothetical protein
MRRDLERKHFGVPIIVWYAHFLYIFFALSLYIFFIWFLTINHFFWGDMIFLSLFYIALVVYFNIVWRKRLKVKHPDWYVD